MSRASPPRAAVGTPPAEPRHSIRRATPADHAALDDICRLTGLNGQDATSAYRDPHLLAEVYLDPYLELAGDLAFVLAGPEDRPVGYVLGVADTAGFEELCEARWWPAARQRHPRGSAPSGTPDARLVDLLHQPQRTPTEVLVEYPAHLHVDLLPVAQGGGNGRRLLEHLFAALRDRGVPGVHLGVASGNPGAIGFYRHLGFQTLDADEHGARLGLLLT